MPESRTTDRLAAVLAHKLMLDSAEVAEQLADQEFCNKYGCDTSTAMALFIPDTYEVYWNISLDKLMKKMEKANNNFWNEERTTKANAMGLTKDEVATLASIVDEETANNSEKPMIAGMYFNRLKKGMPLQADPTIKFALKDFALRRIYHKLLTVDSPYNTYKNAGLPPGAISNPGIVALSAATNPPKTNYYFFQVADPQTGRHVFTKSFEEHIENHNLVSKKAAK